MEQVTYTGGAKRSGKMPLYVKVTHSFIRRIAEAMTEGQHYDEGLPLGAQNWKLGDRQFALDVFDHAVAHLFELKEQALDGLLGDPTPFAGEDNLAHLGANLVMIDFFQAKGMYAPERSEATVVEDLTPAEFMSDEFQPAVLSATQEAAESVTTKLLRILTGAAA